MLGHICILKQHKHRESIECISVKGMHFLLYPKK